MTDAPRRRGPRRPAPVPLDAQLPAELVARLDRAAAWAGIDRAALLARLVERYVGETGELLPLPGEPPSPTWAAQGQAQLAAALASGVVEPGPAGARTAPAVARPRRDPAGRTEDERAALERAIVLRKLAGQSQRQIREELHVSDRLIRRVWAAHRAGG